jgi:hypothetical protein
MKPDSVTSAEDDAVDALARLIFAQMNSDRRPMHVAIKMARSYFAHICASLLSTICGGRRKMASVKAPFRNG